MIIWNPVNISWIQHKTSGISLHFEKEIFVNISLSTTTYVM